MVAQYYITVVMYLYQEADRSTFEINTSKRRKNERENRLVAFKFVNGDGTYIGVL